GRLSIVQEGIEPEISPHKGYVNVHEARHPLLEGEVVPIDLWLGEDFATLVITGPNTGGKTVSLKTLGLLTLMAQSGLHVPAEPGTKIPIFAAVYADIGDEQSLQQSLSSFSSHMTQIIKIVQRMLAIRQAGQAVNVLVLLDEIGAGTDPSEGAALAMSLLEWFHEAGCRTVATTHYNELKAFAYAREGMENASVEFDVQTLTPTYHLQIGSPGSSNAFEIAQRLGLPASMAGRGRDLLEGESRDFVQALEHVQHTQRELHAEQRQAQQTRQELEGLRDQYERRSAQLQQQREQAVCESFEDARQIVAKARSRADQIINELQQQDRHTAESEEMRQELKDIEADVEEAQQEFQRQQQATAQQVPRELPLVESITRGDRVYVPAFSREGAVREVLDEETALVQIGQISIELNISDLRQSPEQPEQTVPESGIRPVQARKRVSVPRELELRGMTVEEALAELDKYLDDASLAGLEEVRIIHGKGTGALREAVHNFLDGHRAVRSFQLADRTAGGEGATEVDLLAD
ncbi:MAG: Smr/MutS family protein, partial [Armatimonadetes bacterium]|nr:Smr/MutS family protein [Armatimonadota bacterium]